MKKTLQFTILALAAILAVSCSQEQILEGSKNNEPVIITATFDQNGTKSTLAEDGVTPKWSVGDEIWLSDGTNTSTVTVAAAGTSFSFAKPVALTGTTLYAVYPATAAKGVTDGNIGIEIPSCQDGTFASANICVAQTDGTSLSFKNATAILKFTQSTAGVNNILIQSTNGISESLSVTYGETLTTDSTATGKSICVRANSSPTIYIAVAPATLADGTKFTFMTANKYLIRSTTAGKPLSANDLVNMGSMDSYSITESLYVDLGLSVKWAKFNVGATSSTELGDYFAWGATEPLHELGYAQNKSANKHFKTGKSDGYAWVNTPYQTASTTDESSTRWTKYLGSTTSEYKDPSATDADALKTVLDATDDAATVNWGDDWRMPTKAEWEELLNTANCTWEWYGKDNTEFGGVQGCKVTSLKSGHTDKFIFLPCAGYIINKAMNFIGSYGYYWSSSLIENTPPIKAYCLYFYNQTKGLKNAVGSYYRNRGHQVRPVCE